MDNVTHTLFAATLARTPLGRVGRGATAALILASNAPDIDIVATAGGALKYLEWHRGPTHGLLGIVGLGLVTAGLAWTGRFITDHRWRNTPHVENASYGMLATVSIIGVLLHVLMDLPTSYGSRVLSPFDWHWYAFDWMPILDIYLWIALGAGLAFGRGSESARRRNAAIVLALVAANYGMRAVAHDRAVALAPRVFGPLLPERCETAPDASVIERWPIETSPASPSALPSFGGARNSTRCLIDIAAIPDFISPFRWRVIAELSNGYEVRDVNLLDRRFGTPPSGSEATWRLALRYPNEWTPAVFKASGTRVAQVFLGFSRFPSVRSVVDRDGVATVDWSDVRFAGSPGPRGHDDARGTFFGATVRIGPDGRVLQEQLGR